VVLAGVLPLADELPFSIPSLSGTFVAGAYLARPEAWSLDSEGDAFRERFD
jgi:hypothetical protein